MYFSKYARKVVMLVRGDLAKSMSQYDRSDFRRTTLRVQVHSSVVEAKGEIAWKRSRSLIPYGREADTSATSLFIFIGALPRTLLDGVVERDKQGFILSGADLMRDRRRPRAGT